ncbi:MAG: hypothetical protein V4519_04840 [Patescibacteria group bacterium]
MYHQDGKVLIKIIVIILIIVGIGGYSLYQAKNLISGPKISLAWPQNGATLDNPAVAIKGMAKNIAYISLNDRQIFVDKDGNFNEELLLAPGYNIWKLEAKDKFGRNVVKKIELVLNKAL